MSNTLNIYYKKNIVGRLCYDAETDRYSLEYEPEWVQQGFAISPYLPLLGELDSRSIHKFLENLLPEGRGLDDLSRFAFVSKRNTIALTRLIGEETTGALAITEKDLGSVETRFIPVSRSDIAHRMDNQPYKSLTIWNDKPRLSAAGLQEKLLVCIRENEYGFGEGDLASTHILKFEKESSRHLVINEFICMSLAYASDLYVPPVTLERIGRHPALCVERFDRKMVNNNLVERLHIIDGCQALDLPPSYKYEHNFGNRPDVNHIRDGASFEKLFQFCQHCKTPAKAELLLIQWLITNTIFSNADAHGKNISFFVDRSGIHVAPFYDIVNIELHPEFDQDMAMGIGDCFNFKDLSAWHLREMCKDCNLSEKLVLQQLKIISKRVLSEIEIFDIKDILVSKEELNFANRLIDNIKAKATELNEYRFSD